MAQQSTLRYPRDLAEQSGDWVMFQFYEYKSAFAPGPPEKQLVANDVFLDKYNSISFAPATEKNKNGEVVTNWPTIGLYMPEDIGGNYAANWGGRDFSPLGAALMGSVGSINGADQGALETGVQSAVKSLDSMKGGLMPWFAAKAVQAGMNGIPGFGGGVGINDVLASTQGKILNPNTEVLYSGPQLRTFGLTFKMNARNEKESNDIRTICNTFKRAMLPRASTATQVLVQVPHIVQVTFKNKTKDSKWVTQYKKCAIGSVDINYTADGAWSTFESGAPTAVILTLQFSELKLLFADEITDSTNY
jgi:hypothetical protein